MLTRAATSPSLRGRTSTLRHFPLPGRLTVGHRSLTEQSGDGSTERSTPEGRACASQSVNARAIDSLRIAKLGALPRTCWCAAPRVVAALRMPRQPFDALRLLMAGHFSSETLSLSKGSASIDSDPPALDELRSTRAALLARSSLGEGGRGAPFFATKSHTDAGDPGSADIPFPNFLP